MAETIFCPYKPKLNLLLQWLLGVDKLVALADDKVTRRMGTK
jgi:hypothetical protein